MPIFNFCCCCCRLQTGGVVLGYIESFVSLILLMVGVVVVAKVDTVTEALNELLKKPEFKNLDINEPGEDIHIDSKTIKNNMIAFVVITSICLLVSILLIVAATKRKYKLILPYLGVKLVYFVYVIYEYIVVLVNDGDTVGTTTQFLVYFGFSVYLWLCVFSLFQELREQPNASTEAYLMQQQPYNPQVYKPSTIPN